MRARRFLFACRVAFTFAALYVAASNGASFVERVEAVNSGASDPIIPVATGAPVTLAARAADLTIRFNHFEPRAQAHGVAAHWAFDEGSGYEFRDSTACEHTAHITVTASSADAAAESIDSSDVWHHVYNNESSFDSWEVDRTEEA